MFGGDVKVVVGMVVSRVRVTKSSVMVQELAILVFVGVLLRAQEQHVF
jgi:hypothetical protein